MEYNYLDAVREDVRNYIDENKDEILEAVNYEEGEDVADYMDEIAEYLNDTLWTYDGVTGNVSGSYWFNAWKAEEAICHNLDELEEACDEFGSDMGEVLKQGAESADVTIRCYLLGARHRGRTGGKRLLIGRRNKERLKSRSFLFVHVQI